MKILFVISLLSFFALLWAAVAIMRHIRTSAIPLTETHPDFVPAALGSSSQASAAPGATARKPSRQGHFSSHKRSDWDYFNKDSGNLQDPALPKRNRSVPASARKPSARRA